MENQDKNEVLSRAVKAGKRTYFFDVKKSRNEEMYLTITESKRKFNADNGNFFYEKHKIFLYKEDFEKFKNALTGVIDFIENGIVPEDTFIENDNFEKTDDDMDLGITFDDIDLSL
ncbi:MAG: DUF3276 family protein [Bacteroidales bacterium]|jgi:hypothetical protein|nr:DUF3276 family protein [Bacteroidales bacterium]MBR4647932.1 DUF3276 family protein [Bacteroidales bacterium]